MMMRRMRDADDAAATMPPALLLLCRYDADTLPLRCCHFC